MKHIDSTSMYEYTCPECGFISVFEYGENTYCGFCKAEKIIIQNILGG